MLTCTKLLTCTIFDYYSKEVDTEAILIVIRKFNAVVLSFIALDGKIIYIQVKSDAVIVY